MTTAEIVTIGTEILLGEIVDTNTRHIALTLRDLGVDLYRTVTVGDNVDRIATAIREACQRNEIVITTGGLGPTVDDPTRDAVARALAQQTDGDDHDRSLIVARLALTPEQRLDANTEFLRWYFSVRPHGPLIDGE